MADDNPPIIQNQNDSLGYRLFWYTLITVAISGAANYFILRFTHGLGLSWLILAPILYLVSIFIIYVVTCPHWRESSRCSFRPYLKYSGTWVIAYFVVGTAIFYYGW